MKHFIMFSLVSLLFVSGSLSYGNILQDEGGSDPTGIVYIHSLNEVKFQVSETDDTKSDSHFSFVYVGHDFYSSLAAPNKLDVSNYLFEEAILSMQNRPIDQEGNRTGNIGSKHFKYGNANYIV
jgi:hypothetical protein